ncbi:MAG: AMP-binding protein [Parvibaculaceae bacterium]
MTETIYDIFVEAAKKSPENPFLCIPDERPGKSKDISYAEIAAQVEVVRKTYEKARFGHGHRVAMLLGARPDFVVHYLALNGLGCTIVPVNPDYRHAELLYLIDHSEADMAVALGDRVAELDAVGKELKRRFPVIDIDKFGDGIPNAVRPAPESGTPGPKSIAAILYTSGTTGQPKGCLMSNECHLICGSWYRDFGGALAMDQGVERFYNPSPFYHVNNLSVCLTCVMLTRNCLILVERFSPSKWWPEIVSSNATVVHYLGIIPSMLMKLPAAAHDRAHKVKFGFGAGIEPQLHGPFEERFGFPCVEIWGMTEIPRVFAANHEPRQVDTRAFGRPIEGEEEARIVDDNDREVPHGEMGELVVRTAGANPRHGFFSGYLKNEEATEEAWRGGWFHTGDICTQSEDGMLYFVDRKKNIVRRGGENISAVEVEAAILTHPAVSQVAVIAAPDELREEEVMACVVLKEGTEVTPELPKEIFNWCNEKIAYFKTPGWMIFLDSLPLTPSQRLQRTRIFPPGADPREQPGVVDLREMKKRK